MAKKPKVELVGIEDVEKILNQLPKQFQARVINAALKEASKPLLEAAKRNLGSAPHGGDLVRMVRQISRRVHGIPGQEIGFMPTKRARRSEAVWEDMGGWWLEFGTMEHMIKPREPSTRPLHVAQMRVGSPPATRGRIFPQAWLRKAVDMTDKEIEDSFRNILWGKLNKSLRRYAKKIKWGGFGAVPAPRPSTGSMAGYQWARSYAKAKGRI